MHNQNNDHKNGNGIENKFPFLMYLLEISRKGDKKKREIEQIEQKLNDESAFEPDSKDSKGDCVAFTAESWKSKKSMLFGNCHLVVIP